MAGREILMRMVQEEASEKPLSWWRRRAPHLPPPVTVDEALQQQDVLRQPCAIQVKPVGQYTEIGAVRFG